MTLSRTSCLHFNDKGKGKPAVNMPNDVVADSQGDSESSISQVCGHTGAGDGDAAMAIVLVMVKLKNGMKTIDTYAFLDPAAVFRFVHRA